MTVSRVSVFVLLIALVLLLLFQKKKLAIFSLLLMAVVAFIFLSFTPALLDRFGNTVKEVDVLVEAKSGEVVGHTKIMPKSYFENKVVKRRIFQNRKNLDAYKQDEQKDPLKASSSAIFPQESIPQKVVLIVAPNDSTGKSLPQGTGYINLPLSPVLRRLGEFYYESVDKQHPETLEVFRLEGDFLIKRASAYDLSFTTRFQGEWPKALKAFKRNILFGSGYSSVGLAVDNNYLRILGEVGLLGFVTFFAIFIASAIYIKKVLPDVDSKITKSFVLGFAAGTVGLMLNAVLIDVFEASKIALLLWLLAGITLGVLSLYQVKQIHILKELKNVATSPYAIILYLLIASVVMFSPMIANYFVGDDFTWFRWADTCGAINAQTQHCSALTTINRYFTQSDGFFYRPATKVYFFLMYSVFWLNQTVYHLVSLSLHFIVASILFLLAKKIMRSTLLSASAAFLFLIMSGYSEIVFWVSATGHLFNAVFMLLSLLFFIMWDEKRRLLYFIVSLISFSVSLLFHELGVVVPILMILYKFTTDEEFTIRKLFKKFHYLAMLFPVIFYLIMRYMAQSHWFAGDYNYNLLKLPFNFMGNILGYFSLAFFGPISLTFYTTLRNFSKGHIVLALIASIALGYILFLGYRLIIRSMKNEEKRMMVFGIGFFVIALLPFLGLGNIASRYSYLASVGASLLLVFFIKKLYVYLQSNGKDIAIACIAALIGVFALLHIIQVQQMHGDWHEAGERVKRFSVGIDGLYSDQWSKESLEFHFVNVPIRSGTAWVFPVGLPDALWFIFRNPKISVHTWNSLQEAVDALPADSKDKKLFLFDDVGMVREVNIVEEKKNLKNDHL